MMGKLLTHHFYNWPPISPTAKFFSLTFLIRWTHTVGVPAMFSLVSLVDSHHMPPALTLFTLQMENL